MTADLMRHDDHPADMVLPPVVAIGASAGGVGALRELVGALPTDFPAAVLVVLHVSATAPSHLAEILARSTDLPVVPATDLGELEPGTVYVASPDRHLEIRHGRMHVWRGPRENGHRPSIDALFRSVASTLGPSAAGVLLTGMLDDGVAGLMELKEAGGATLVQDPEEALFPSMPRAAVAAGAADQVLRIEQMADAIQLLDLRPATISPIDEEPQASAPPIDDPGEPSPFSCPSCGGVLRQARSRGELEHFQCRVGHRFSPDSLLEAQSTQLDEAMWAGFRSLKEQAELSRRIASRLERIDSGQRAHTYEHRALEADRRADILYESLSAQTEDVPD